MTAAAALHHRSRSGPARAVVLAGWAAKGVVYAALGWLVLQLATGKPAEEASPQGAIEYLGGTGAGGVALVLVGAGLLAYAAGRVLEVTVLATPRVDTKDKVAGFGLAVVYLVLAISAFAAVGGGEAGSSSSGGDTSKQASSFLLELPAGPLLVVLLGAAVAGAGLYMAWKGVQRSFLETLRTGEMPGRLRRTTELLGTAAYVTKGAVFVLIGWFLVQAAVSYDPDEAKGLDATLREVADASWGPLLLVGVAVGFLMYAGFCAIEARYRRVGSGPSGT